MTVETKLLDAIHDPADLRRLKESELRQLADELRAETISAVSVTGGPLGAGLGVVGLTLALNYVFSPTHDKMVWSCCDHPYPPNIVTAPQHPTPPLLTTS